MAGTVERSSRQSFELLVRSPVECVMSRRPDGYKPESFRPLRRPRAILDDLELPCTCGSMRQAPKSAQESFCVLHGLSGDGLPPSSPSEVPVVSAASDRRLRLSDSHSRDDHVRSAALPSPDVSGDIAVPKPDSPGGTTETELAVTMRLLAAVAKVYGRGLSSKLPLSVQAENEYVSRFTIRVSYVKQISDAFKKPNSVEDVLAATNALETFHLQLKDLKQGLLDSMVSREHVDNLLRALSSRKVLGRVYNVLNRVFCGQRKNPGKSTPDGGEQYGRRIIQFLCEATELHKMNRKLKSEKRARKNGFLVYYLFEQDSYKHGECIAEIESELDKLDMVLGKLVNMECVDKPLVDKLLSQLEVSASGKVPRTAACGRGADTPGPSPNATETFSGPLSSALNGRGTLRPKGDYAGAAMRKALAKSNSHVPVELDPTPADQREKRRPEPVPLVVHNVAKYRSLTKRTYTPRPGSQKSVLSVGRRKPSAGHARGISFSGPVSAVEIEHHADRRNYDGCDPLRRASKEHADEVSSRCELLSRRACFTIAMATEFDVSNRDRKACGLPTETVLNYRMQALKP